MIRTVRRDDNRLHLSDDRRLRSDLIHSSRIINREESVFKYNDIWTCFSFHSELVFNPLNREPLPFFSSPLNHKCVMHT